jgi:hypothetical protein
LYLVAFGSLAELAPPRRTIYLSLGNGVLLGAQPH